MKNFLLVLSILIALGLTSCPPPAGVYPQFKISITITGDGAGAIAPCDVAGILLSVINGNGESVHSLTKFNVTADNGSYVTGNIDFQGENGYYTITGLLVLDKNEQVIGIVPKKGSIKGSAVNIGLPYRFLVQNGMLIIFEAVPLSPAMNAADFGYTVNVAQPANTGTVSGQVSIQAAVDDDYSIARVEFYVDGTTLATDTEAPYSCTWDTTMVTNGTHTLIAKAYDSIGFTMTDNDTQVTVLNQRGLSKISIAAGAGFSLAVVTGDKVGMVYAWGANNAYQLGNGDITPRQNPAEVTGLDMVTAVAAGNSHALALKSDGTVLAWGLNSSGQVGNNSTTNQAVPVDIGLSSITAIACGREHSFALRNDGVVLGFGINDNGELGLGSVSNPILKPTPIPGLTNVIAIDCGADYSLVLKDNGTVWAAGDNSYGRLGDGTTTQRTSFVQVKDDKNQNLDQVVAITAGYYHSHAIKKDGTVWSWGYNGDGELGDASRDNRYQAVKVNGITDARAAAAGEKHVLILKKDGTVWSWGYNQNGELGDNSTINKPAPVKIENLSNIVYIAASLTAHSMAVDISGNVYTWGYNGSYQLGDGSTGARGVPYQVSGLKAYVEAVTFQPITPYAPQRSNKLLAAGIYHSSIINSNDPGKGILSWGFNGYGQLGDNTAETKTTPVSALNLDNVVSIAGGGMYSLALTNNGKIYACGLNTYGMLGDGTTTQRNTYQGVQTAPGAVFAAIAAGGQHNGADGYVGHSLALKNDGTVWAWGYNAYGQLGDCTTTHRSYPVKVNGLDHVAEIACGSLASYALKADGTVWTWGHNGYGQLGDCTVIDKYAPVQVEGLAGITITAIAPGSWHVLAQDDAGNLYAWGSNTYGELGDGSKTSSSIPIQVPVHIQFKKIACGPEYSLAITNDNALYAWGCNNNGNLGDGTTLEKTTPCRITAIANVAEIAASRGYDSNNLYSHSLAITTDGQVWGWGYSSNGQLGDGTITVYKAAPVKVHVPWYQP